MSSVDIVAAVEPPVASNYQHYPDYLQDFTHFLDFLAKHPNVVSAPTNKRVMQPSMASFDKTLSGIEKAYGKAIKKREPVYQDSEDSDWTTMADKKPAVATSVDLPQEKPKVIFATPPLDSDIEKAVLKRAAVESKPVHLAPASVQPKVIDTLGCQLLGKKACRKQLETVCTSTLAAHIVTFDKISREPDKFAKQLEFLRAKAARFGVEKLGLDRAKKNTFETVSNGRVGDRDFMAEWRDTDSADSG
jgi:hypothetical protein